MQSTVDWAEEMSTGNSAEALTTSAIQPGPRLPVPGFLAPYRATMIVLFVVGMLASVLILLGLWLAGRSKFNASSAYIANHTTLERTTFSGTLNMYEVSDILFLAVAEKLDWISVIEMAYLNSVNQFDIFT